MTEKIIIDVSNCSHKRDDECMEVPICNEYGDLMGYQSCEAQTLCPYRSQKKIECLEQLKNKYYQQTLDDEITISDLIEEIQELKADRTLERISKLSIENASLEQERDELLEEVKQLHNGRSTEELYTLFGKPIKYWEELEQENKELKETIKQYCKWLDEERESNDKLQKVYQDDNCDLLNYRSALEEIKRTVMDIIEDNGRHNLSDFSSPIRIEKIINEVLQ